jgi:outer membrane protein OmpA-like peptidoglycan-associated protein
MNLLETLKTKYGSTLAVHTAEFFDEEQVHTSDAVGGSFAAIMAGLIQRVSYDKGAKDLYKVVKAQDVREYDIENIFTRSPQTVNGLINRGNHFLPSVYPGRLREASNSVAKHSSVTKLTSSKMMKVSAPLILTAIAKHVKENNLDASGLKSFLSGQKDHVKSALPAGFIEESELSAFGWVKKEKIVEEKPKKIKKVKKEKIVKVEEPIPVAKAVTPVSDTSGGGLGFLKWLLPLLAIILLAWFLITKIGCGGAVDKVATTVAAPIEAAKDVTEDAASAVTNVFGKVNDAALSALNSISFAAGSVGEQMMGFIKGGAEGDGRFRFNNLNFASGSDVIDAASQVEVDNLAAILNAYTDVKVNIEGYTDSQGNAESNQSLSQRRAEAVRAKLLAAGINDARITSQGFGAENPIADNGTKEGRAQNRRIEVVIIK